MDGKRSFLKMCGVIALSGAMAACAGAAPSQSGVVTKVGGNAASILKPTMLTVTGPGLELDFSNSVKKLSAGTIDVTVTGDWRHDDLSNEANLVAEVAAGRAELGYLGARGFDTAGINSFAGLQAPMLIDSYDLEARVLATDWAAKLLDGPRWIGIVGLGYTQGELRQAVGVTRRSAAGRGFSGSADRDSRPSHVSEMTFKALGATPVAIPASAVNISALDGVKLVRPPSQATHTIGAPSPSPAISCFWARPNVIFANAKWFDGLSADQQGEGPRAAAAATGTLSAAGVHGSAEEARNILCARHFSITSASRQALDAFHQKLQPVIDEMTKSPQRPRSMSITDLRGPVDAPDVFASCPIAVATPSPSTGPTPLDGTWKTSFTKARPGRLASPHRQRRDQRRDRVTFDHVPSRTGRSRDAEEPDSKLERLRDIQGGWRRDLPGDRSDGRRFPDRWSIYKNTLTSSSEMRRSAAGHTQPGQAVDTSALTHPPLKQVEPPDLLARRLLDVLTVGATRCPLTLVIRRTR